MPQPAAHRTSPHRIRWMFERRRVLLSAIAALIVAAVVFPAAAVSSQFAYVDALVVVLLVYLVVHMVITGLVFHGATDADIDAWAERDSRGTFAQRYLLGTAPGPGASIFVAAVAMFVAMVWLPGNDSTSLPTWLRITIGVTLVVVAWCEVLLSFTVTFRADDALEDDSGLDFPGTRNPAPSDYVYFALSVMVTFGTTDVSVTSSDMRKTVTANAIIAFVFNTVIVAAAVSVLMG
ncbi:DUF1345 domain-containing protein [Brevibacterium rongguiense]|nr:DUF1345 domain-containing protein [Brevibacterium rongguiense]